MYTNACHRRSLFLYNFRSLLLARMHQRPGSRLLGTFEIAQCILITASKLVDCVDALHC